MNASIIHDPNFPHGSPEGFQKGCHGSHCPAPVICRDVFIRFQGDYVFRRALDAGMTAAEFVATEQERAQEAAQAAKEARQAQIREAARLRHNEARRQRREAKKPTRQLIRDGIIRTELQAHIHALHRRGLTDGEIGFELGKTREQVKAIRGALKLAPNKLPTIEARLKQLHGEGKTDMEIAVELGKHHRYIAQRRRDFGLPLNRKAPATTGASSLPQEVS